MCNNRRQIPERAVQFLKGFETDSFDYQRKRGLSTGIFALENENDRDMEMMVMTKGVGSNSSRSSEKNRRRLTAR
jgi:hypothetical protein